MGCLAVAAYRFLHCFGSSICVRIRSNRRGFLGLLLALSQTRNARFKLHILVRALKSAFTLTYPIGVRTTFAQWLSLKRPHVSVVACLLRSRSTPFPYVRSGVIPSEGSSVSARRASMDGIASVDQVPRANSLNG